MNKYFLTSFLSLLLLISTNANSASTLQWKAISVDVFPNTNIILGLIIEPEFDRQSLFNESNNEMDFTQAWSFNVTTKTATTREAVNFFNTQLDNANQTINDIFVAGSENIAASFSVPKNDIQLAASPIPAVAWLLGSCLFGISGLLYRRESVTTNS